MRADHKPKTKRMMLLNQLPTDHMNHNDQIKAYHGNNLKAPTPRYLNTRKDSFLSENGKLLLSGHAKLIFRLSRSEKLDGMTHKVPQSKTLEPGASSVTLSICTSSYSSS